VEHAQAVAPVTRVPALSGGAPAASGGARHFGWAAVAAVPSGLAMLALSGRKARARLRSRVTLLDADPLIRVGHGYDIHRMASREEAGQPVVIGGVKFDGSDAPDFELGCVAHSDGDVIYHSVVDAILGALTMPDIGQLFPDNDPRLKGADSSIFMVEAYDRMRKRGYSIGNVDVTLICQKPRVNIEHAGGQVKEKMIANVARLLKTEESRVNVKARTHEKVDSVGECRALECHVVMVLQHD
jgi:2-C-methyl-D-erythritol 2,4-cyclodiphosphate synthase